MKRIIFINLCIIFTGASMYAQSVINPVIGFNYPSIANSSKSIQHAPVKRGHQIGVNIRQTESTFFLEYGLHLLQSNQALISRINVPGLEQHETLNSISIQNVMRAGVATHKGEGPFCMRLAGGFVFNNPLSVKSGQAGITKDDFKHCSMGGITGVGIDLYFFTLDLDYQFNINNPFEDSDTYGYGNFLDRAKNVTLMISTGVKF